MTMRINPLLAVALGAALTLASAAAPTPAAAAPPRVNALNCKTLAKSMAKSSIWSTSFYGQRTDFWNHREFASFAPCFRSQQDCKAWLYWAQTDWSDYNRWKPCHTGLPG